MIKKMKILDNLNLDYFREKRKSVKKLNNIALRIKRIENDINDIQTNENFSFIAKSNRIPSFDKNGINRTSRYNNYTNKFGYLKESFQKLNNTENNKFFSKKKTKKLFEKKYQNKNNNYNNFVLKKKNIILNLNSTKINDNNDMNIMPLKELNLTTVNKNKKHKLLFSFDAAFTNRFKEKYEQNKNNLIITKNNQLNELDYKFEIIQYKKELEALKNKKKDIIKKLKEIIRINKNTQNKIIIDEYNQKPLDNIILLLKNNEHLIDNHNIKENSFYENIILNIMDLRYSSERSKLIDAFYEGMKKLLKINDDNYFNTVGKINDLINSQTNLINTKNKFSYLLRENNQIYFDYIKQLLNKFNISTIPELFNYIKNMYIRNIKESDTFEKIKVNVMKDLKKKKQNFLPNNQIHKSNNSMPKKFSNLQTNINFSKCNSNSTKSLNKIKYLSNQKTNNINDSGSKSSINNSYDINSKKKQSLGYIMISNGKDKMIKVNKRDKNDNKEKNLIEKLRKIKINNILEFEKNNNLDNIINKFSYK